MKTKFYKGLLKIVFIISVHFTMTEVIGQTAVVATPAGIGTNCGAGNASDSFRVLNYNDKTLTLNLLFGSKPNLGGGSPAGPAFSSSAGSVAFNPKDQNVYYIATTTGTQSFVYNWSPNNSVSTQKVYSYYYPNDFVVGLDFSPLSNSGDGYQLQFTGSPGSYILYLRKINFASNYFGPPDTLVLSAGKQIYQQNGDIIFTPQGQLYFAFDNKLFQIDYSTYGNSSQKLNATFIDSLRFTTPTDYLTGIAYAHGKFVGSVQASGGSPCYFREIDISSGSAVINPVTLPNNNFTATDMATIITGIGVARRVYAVAPWSSNRWIVQYDIKIRNYGNTNINNVQLKDSIAKVFGACFDTATVVAVGTLPSGLTINPSYNGNTDCNIFTGGSSSTLMVAPADSATVRVTVVLTNPNLNTFYYSSSIGSAQSILFTQSVSDSSNNDGALRADPNNNGIPDDVGEGVPTPLRINDWYFLANNIIDFNAEYKDNVVPLHWELQNTEDGLKANIQRSTDGINFQTLNTMPLLASNDRHEYSWVDNKPAGKNNYYRLQFVPKNGNIFYSKTVVISIKDIKPIELVVTPNPFYQNIGFEINLPKNEKVIYKLYDFNSRLIYSGERIGQSGMNKFSINNLANMLTGSYLLQAIIGNEVHNKMVIKTQ